MNRKFEEKIDIFINKLKEFEKNILENVTISLQFEN